MDSMLGILGHTFDPSILKAEAGWADLCEFEVSLGHPGALLHRQNPVSKNTHVMGFTVVCVCKREIICCLDLFPLPTALPCVLATLCLVSPHPQSSSSALYWHCPLSF